MSENTVDRWEAFAHPVESLRGSGVLARVNIKLPSGSKLDKALTQELSAQKGIKGQMARVNKKLFSWEALDAVNKKANELRNYHTENTFAWDALGARGTRFLPSSKLFEYETVTNRLKNELTGMVQDLEQDYDQAVQASRALLGAAWEASDYPSKEEFLASFQVQVQVEPIPDTASLPEMSSHLANAVSTRIRQSLVSNFKGVHRQVYDRVREVVGHMAETLKDEENNRFHSTLVTNVGNVVEMLREFNIFGDDGLTELACEIEDELTGLTAQELKEDPTKRKAVQHKANKVVEQISNRMANIFEAGL